MNYNDEEALDLFNRLLERLQQTGHTNQGSKIEFVYVASGGQHVETQIIASPSPPQGREKGAEGAFKGEKKGAEEAFKEDAAEGIRHCITLLMQEKCGNEPLFNQQNHWQAVYRILVDKGYCRDSDFDGFDAFIRTRMPEEVNKPYKKDSVRNINKTDFNKPFDRWKYDPATSGTRKPYERMATIAKHFKALLEENGACQRQS